MSIVRKWFAIRGLWESPGAQMNFGTRGSSPGSLKFQLIERVWVPAAPSIRHYGHLQATGIIVHPFRRGEKQDTGLVFVGKSHLATGLTSDRSPSPPSPSPRNIRIEYRGWISPPEPSKTENPKSRGKRCKAPRWKFDHVGRAGGGVAKASGAYRS